MGAAVSDWRLARAVSLTGQLGVVSGTALATVLARRLQLGDPEGHCRRALDQFPVPAIARDVLEAYYIPGGKAPDQPFKLNPPPSLQPSASLERLTLVANFVEVFLAKHGHEGPVGLNLLEKIQLPTMASLYGAMLAGVDYVLMGAGIPRSIPGVLDRFAQGLDAELEINVVGAAPGETFRARFDPAAILGRPATALRRPFFLAIVSSTVLATSLARKSNGKVDGFVVEGMTAGGHNAPPRGPLVLDDRGEPVYGPRDIPDLEKIRDLGLPFWLAGGYGRPGGLEEAQRLGAEGIQVGTAFAFCAESGIQEELRARALAASAAGQARVHTDPLASPTGFPFKVLQMPGTLSETPVYEERERICDLGYLRMPYRREDGSIGYRCPGEEVDRYVAKGGEASETVSRMCLCNGLLATVGLAQVRGPGLVEPALLTAGEEVEGVAAYRAVGESSYTAASVVRTLLGEG